MLDSILSLAVVVLLFVEICLKSKLAAIWNMQKKTNSKNCTRIYVGRC